MGKKYASNQTNDLQDKKQTKNQNKTVSIIKYI